MSRKIKGDIVKKKELKHLNRRELLQILLNLAEENERLREELTAARNELEGREFVMKEAGSIAEASLQLSGIFDAAETAAKSYVETLQKLAAKQEAEYLQRTNEARETAYVIISEATSYSKRKHEEADAYVEAAMKKVEESKR